MDPSIAGISALDVLAPLLTGGIVAAVTGLTGAGAAVTLHALQRRHAWLRSAARLGLRAAETCASPLATPGLFGIYRGRASEVSLLPSGQTRVAVRIANPRRLLDTIRADDTSALAAAQWLNGSQRQEIGALRDHWRRAGSITVRSNFVTLIASEATGKPDHLSGLLDLAASVAETVDSAPTAFAAAPVRGRRRFASGPMFAAGRDAVCLGWKESVRLFFPFCLTPVPLPHRSLMLPTGKGVPKQIGSAAAGGEQTPKC